MNKIGLFVTFFFTSCIVGGVVGQVSKTKKSTSVGNKVAVSTIKKVTQASNSLTNNSTSNANGLKEALVQGVTNAVLELNKQDGYYGNEVVKILLPKEAEPLLNNIKLVPGGKKMIDDVVIRLNRAAEDAAGEAKPIFVTAIKNLNIVDATSILFGKDEAGATNYLKKSTNDPLTIAFRPKIDASLDKQLVGTLSTNDAWNLLTSSYNKVAKSFVGVTAGLTPVKTDLGAYVTEQALNGLFTTVGNEEAKIRKNPAARVSNVLQSVFGQLDKK